MIREAHATTKDLRATVREAWQESRALARDEVAAQIRLEASRQLKELGERTGEAITVATQKVIAEFDRFGESLLGKEAYRQKASGRAPGHRFVAARHPARRREELTDCGRSQAAAGAYVTAAGGRSQMRGPNTRRETKRSTDWIPVAESERLAVS